ncbi:AAA family ATPase [Sphaerospermopsis sp. LEGE 00249]|uniref:McrB family protein n=1 Tax=Sphaerospermopsis sp. LEGE 00249 TaxID=1380707 RepID=UPI00164D1646|nr:AAA family ATPase [Sphaerospermopsis sp. LEGE 00249]MBC5795948.1 AAA family ATPase [Sphaerospermopsis sp. LEGE 00249]
MSQIKTLKWNFFKGVAPLAFNVFDSEKELIWAEESWNILIKIGLANYSNSYELSQVKIFFLALSDFYNELCSMIWTKKYPKPDYLEIAKQIQIRAFHIGQIISTDSTWKYDNEQNQFSLALERLIQNSRYNIAKSLIYKFGSEAKLLIWIYRSLETEVDYHIDDRYDDNEDISFFSYKTDQEILEILTRENDYALAWLENLCQYQNDFKINLISHSDLESRPNPSYTLYECADDTAFPEDKLDLWIRTIERKKQGIFYGSPGTGKTFIAKKIAKLLISESDGFYELVQFHPAYTYEDFIQGIRPQSENGKLTYPLVPGIFLEFCKKAEALQDTCVLIIDEINRANLPQVFGELMYLLEYRDQEIPLAGGNKFRIPENVRIIGTMNTADRSIAQLDHALRRRFAFIELRPNYDVLRKYHDDSDLAKNLIYILKQLNQAIDDKNYEIGISFFLTPNLRDDIEDIWKMEIEPYLEEYFFNNPEKVDEFRWDNIKTYIQ